MKKTSRPSAAPSPAPFWRPLAIVSLAANVGLVVWGFRQTPPVQSATPAAAAIPAGTIRPVTALRAPAVGPYAALGSFMSENNGVPRLGWTESQFAEFLAGFRSSYEGRPVPLDDEARRLQEKISQHVQTMLAAQQPDLIEDYFRGLREKESVSRTASGLHYRITEPMAGPTPKPEDTVEISFAARLPGGQTVPALSRVRARLIVRDLLPGLAEGVQLLSVGGKALVYLPPTLAFSESDWPPQLPRHAPLIFFLELHDISGAPGP